MHQQECILDLFTRIEAPSCRGPASPEELAATECRLGGKLPERFMRWHLEADGFDGEAEVSMWRFPALAKIISLKTLSPSTNELRIRCGSDPSRIAKPEDYALICDRMIYLPFYAVNIRPESPYFGEVISSAEEWLPDADLAAATFDDFAEALFRCPGDVLIAPAISTL